MRRRRNSSARRRREPRREHPRTPPRRRRGRPRKPGAGVSHRRRTEFDRWKPVHVTLRVRADVRNLRGCALFRTVHGALSRGASKPDFRLVDYSVQRNHFHFNVEASSSRALARGIQGLSIRLARAINRRTRRTGKVFRDRYFSRVLTTAAAALNARRYVLNNARRHVRHASRNTTDWRDPCSSAAFFDYWSIPPGTPHAQPTQHELALAGLPNAAVGPRTFLLSEGWKRAGSLILTASPGPPDP